MLYKLSQYLIPATESQSLDVGRAGHSLIQYITSAFSPAVPRLGLGR